MTGNRTLIFALSLLALPFIVSWGNISLFGVFCLVILMLLWRWGITLSGLIKPVAVPELQLDTISVSHFVEKVRWNMDILGVDYTERPVGGTLGIFFTGRSVPQLRVHTGATRSTISNSSDILRYLWGRYSAVYPENAGFLAPTPERLELEKRIDQYGVNLQIWVYYHILDDRELTQVLWGSNCSSLPPWQRHALVVLFPVLRFLIRKAFRINSRSYQKVTGHIEKFLEEIEQKLSDNSLSILSGDQFDYVDISFASISGIWQQPDAYGGGMAEGVRVDESKMPKSMKDDRDRWQQQYPKATAFIERLYEHRKDAHRKGTQ